MEQFDFQILLTDNYYINPSSIHICFPIKIKTKTNQALDIDADLITVNNFFAHFVKEISMIKYRSNKELIFGITKSCTHLHPASSTSTQLISTFHSAHLSLHSAFCNTLNVIRTKILHVIGQFPQIYVENSKLSVLPKNRHPWYIRGADSESRPRISKFRPQNAFSGKFGPKNSKLSVLP